MDDFSRCRLSLPHLGASTQVFLIPVWPAQDSRKPSTDWLDAQEAQTASGFVHGRDCRLYMLSHLWLRHLLAQATGLAPQAVRMLRGEHGKPRLDGTAASVFFSLSHTHSCIAIALSTHGEVGVDIEGVDLALDVVALQDLVLHRAERDGNPDATQFFRLWTLKEAYAKALGLGFGLPFAQLRMTIHPEGSVAFRDESGLAAPVCEGLPEFHIVDNRPDPAAITVALRA